VLDQIVSVDLLALCQRYDRGTLLPHTDFDELLPRSLQVATVHPPKFGFNQMVSIPEYGLGFIKAYSYRTGGVYCSLADHLVIEVVGHWVYAIVGAEYPAYYWYAEDIISLEG